MISTVPRTSLYTRSRTLDQVVPFNRADAGSAQQTFDMTSLGAEAFEGISALGDFAAGALSGLFRGAKNLAKATSQAQTSPKSTEVPDSVKATGENLLARGHASDEVKALQDLLEKHGYDLGPKGSDGIFGPKTEEALRAFQQSQLDAQSPEQQADPESKFKVDGIAGPQTRGALAALELEAADKAAALNGAGDGAAAQKAIADKSAALSGAGDEAAAQKAIADKAAALNGAGDEAAAQKAIADKALALSGAGDEAAAQKAIADKSKVTNPGSTSTITAKVTDRVRDAAKHASANTSSKSKTSNGGGSSARSSGGGVGASGKSDKKP